VQELNRTWKVPMPVPVPVASKAV